MITVEIQYIARVPTGNGAITAGAVNPDTVETIADAIAGERLDGLCGSPQLHSLEAVPYEEWGVRPSYLKSFRQPFDSANVHLQQGASRSGEFSLVDWWTFTTQERLDRIRTALLDRFLDSDAVEEVAERSDITTALANCFPVLGGHGLDRLLEEPVWDHIKEHRAEQLSAYSQRALRNGENGRAFEERFEAFCEANALDCWKRSKAAFRRHLPRRFEQVADQVDSFAGIPDYFVDKKNTHALSAWMDGIGERAWAPDGRYAFVECKFNASHLSPEQREMVQTLQDVGVAVYLFRGTLDDFEVRRVD